MNIQNPDYDDFEKGLQRLLGAATEPGTEERLREVCAEFRRQLGQHPPIMKPVSASSHATNLSRRAAWVTRLFTLKHWIVTHATANLIIGILMIGTGSAAVVHWLTVQEAAKKFDINDPTLRTVIEAYYRVNQKYPVYFRELTTPVAYITGPWNPDWGKKGEIMSEEETMEWESRPRWEREPFINNIADYHLWESLSPKEQDEWVQWYVEWNSRSHLINERFSPEQKVQFLALRESAKQAIKEITQELAAKHAPKEQIERAQLDAWSKNYSLPLQKTFQEMRLDRPLHSTIRPAVREYREKHHRDPRTLGDLKGFIEGLAPGLLAWQGDRPLKSEELEPLVKWEKLPWDSGDVPREKEFSNDAPRTFDRGRADWRTWESFLKKYGPEEVYDGYVRWGVNRYFESYLLYYPFTDEQRRQISQLGDETFQELKATLQKLVVRRASRRSFENETAAVWDKAIARFYEIFKEMKRVEGGQTTARP